MTPPINFVDWMQQGIVNGWCGAPVCATHDGLPTTAGEDTIIDDIGYDNICIMISRIYDGDTETKHQVEANHTPSVWRDTYTK